MAGHDPDFETEIRRIPTSLPDQLRLSVVSGPDRGKALRLSPGRFVIGKADACDLVLHDPLVSRRHLEVVVDQSEVRLVDLGSSNGSYFDGARFEALAVGVGAMVVIGSSELRLMAGAESAGVPLSDADRFGALLGRSAVMRQLYTILERVAVSDAGILLQGETGVGKELAAEGIHSVSPRRGGPFVICDLAGLPASLIESELFGHVRGAFTGADRDRVGAFVQADGGTIFLDEIGEVSAEVQPRLLRALERRQVKPVGGSTYRSINVRVVAATNRDLEEEVREGRFRRDLYHRLAVACVTIPPLRDRREDIPLLVEQIVAEAARAAGRPVPQVPSSMMSQLTHHDWPGNVRELRNVLEQALALSPGAELNPALLSMPESHARDNDTHQALPFRESRERLIDAWERDYLVDLLKAAGHNVSEAARRAGLSRVYLHELIRKHGLSR
jgi:two-component system, NtrC family, nitrogen regulation response regulator GlnG